MRPTPLDCPRLVHRLPDGRQVRQRTLGRRGARCGCWSSCPSVIVFMLSLVTTHGTLPIVLNKSASLSTLRPKGRQLLGLCQVRGGPTGDELGLRFCQQETRLGRNGGGGGRRSEHASEHQASSAASRAALFSLCCASAMRSNGTAVLGAPRARSACPRRRRRALPCPVVPPGVPPARQSVLPLPLQSRPPGTAGDRRRGGWPRSPLLPTGRLSPCTDRERAGAEHVLDGLVGATPALVGGPRWPRYCGTGCYDLNGVPASPRSWIARGLRAHRRHHSGYAERY